MQRRFFCKTPSQVFQPLIPQGLSRDSALAGTHVQTLRQPMTFMFFAFFFDSPDLPRLLSTSDVLRLFL